MNIGQKLGVLIAVAIAALLAVGATAIIKFSQTASNVDFMSSVAIEGLVQVNQINNAYKVEQIITNQYVNEQNPLNRDKLAAFIDAQHAVLNKSMTGYEASIAEDVDRKNFNEFKTHITEFSQIYEQLRKAAKDGDLATAQTLMTGKGRDAAIAAEAALQKLTVYNIDGAHTKVKEVEEGQSSARLQLIGVVVVALLALLAFGITLYRSITGPLHDMQQIVSQIEASLDFTQRVPVRNQDEIGKTVQAFNRLIERTQHSLREISQRIGNVNQAANEMSRSATEMSANAGKTSEASSSMAATVEEVTVSITHIADRSTEADELARSSGQQAKTGASVIDATVARIDGIASTVRDASEQIGVLREQSANISAVVNTIKEIADQTNLLALNAAIEAARAGELGRGFAVVADEVRKLAERTTHSTQEIATTIVSIQDSAGRAVGSMEQVVQQVGQGVEQARAAGEAIATIRSGSIEVVERVGDISNAIREQSTASTSIAHLVERIAQMSEESSAAAQRTAGAAGNLDQLAGEMQREVARYRL
ncbi:methyl-accepting chemotaxis protein [Andreprevotia lacus DSM 23236]|uniref:Methyl-accepting chemotaxis protein n=1 Tax=Andreprevotia lacus DSM 23236 TaxID=1121001 RepID=A0A1W1X9K9_9NEIS|nr:methyl-accepting chemotaxis protein [Andreprevotia lacus]SMC20579.1 methyl-accepting chemotaxis protein [Andreprevotia lacus DSM 23236]